MCKLHKAIYGLEQATHAWFDHFSSFLLSYGFTCSRFDLSLFTYHMQLDTLILLLYVDDIILTGSSPSLLNDFTHALHLEFDMKDNGPLHYFLGIQVTSTTNGLILS